MDRKTVKSAALGLGWVQAYGQRHPRVTAAINLFLIIVMWVVFLLMKRARVHHPGLLAPVLVLLFALVLFDLGWRARSDTQVGMLLLYFVTVLSLFISLFAIAYFALGTPNNFAVGTTHRPLDHLDALYFTMGNLSTAGTGNIAATSELSRSVQTAQLVSQLPLLLFVVGVLLSRYMGTPPIIRKAAKRKSPPNAKPVDRW